jgi:F0F1-type ATP synthase epsilon subunit
MAENTLLHLRLRNRDKVIFDHDIKSLSSYNQTGLFDILPTHSNFITLVKYKITIVNLNGQKIEYPINSAILRVIRNKIDIFLGLYDQ